MNLEEMRREMDRIDDQMTELFLKRMHLSEEIADFKQKNGLPVLHRGREREILARISGEAGPEYAPFARVLFMTLFDLSRSVQSQKIPHSSPLRARIEEALRTTEKVFPSEAVVACQGIEGANSQIACDKVFRFANIMYVRNFSGVFNAVEKGLCRYGVLPIENSSHGSVNEVYDLMSSHRFSIVRGVRIHVNHCLLARPGADLSGIREICSHEQALGQCGRFLSSLPDVKITVMENTAEAARFVSESGRNDLAAVASEECAEIYGLQILRRSIQDTDNNYTKFIVISKQPEIYPGSDRLSILFTVSNTPGSLSRLIARFASYGLNLSKLESRPISGTDFLYRFYADIDASPESPEVLDLLSGLETDLESFMFLGSYREV